MTLKKASNASSSLKDGREGFGQILCRNKHAVIVAVHEKIESLT